MNANVVVSIRRWYRTWKKDENINLELQNRIWYIRWLPSVIREWLQMEHNNRNFLQVRNDKMRTAQHSVCTWRNYMIQINRTCNTYEKEQGKWFPYKVDNVMPTRDVDAWETNAKALFNRFSNHGYQLIKFIDNWSNALKMKTEALRH
jgi:hypothetical protein